MRIRDYIKKHSLEHCRTFQRGAVTGIGAIAPRSISPVFVKREPIDFPPLDRFEIYSNPERNHFVSLNITSEQFRIIHHELTLMVSDWLPIEDDYAPGKLP
jgi:hypothetical protein